MSEIEQTPDLVSCACPGCQETNWFEPTTVLAEGSEELQLLTAGQLNLMTCHACGQSFLFETPLLYRDDAERMIIYYVPRGFFDRISEPLAHMTEFYKQVFGQLPEDEQPNCRLAVARNQFVEKIALHQNGFDDRIIEYVKYQLLQHASGIDAERHELLYDFGTEDDENIAFLAFERDSGKPAFQLQFALADYHALREELLGTPEMEQELAELFNGYYVCVEDLLE